MIWTLFYYNSLPDFPKKCDFFLEDVMYRDFFKCNPTNTGHHRYPKFESLSYDDGCHKREVGKFLDNPDPDKYVVFYTRHNGGNKVVGYFKVGKTFPNGHKGFKSSDTVLLPKNKCIEIGYESRGVPVSWGHSDIKPTIDKIIKKLIFDQKNDISQQYKESTKNFMDQLKSSDSREKMIDKCENCKFKKECHWGKYSKNKKITRLNELYDETEECSGKAAKC